MDKGDRSAQNLEDQVKTSEEESLIAEDVKTLHNLGYAQELLRRMSGFSNFAVSFSIICILSGGRLQQRWWCFDWSGMAPELRFLTPCCLGNGTAGFGFPYRRGAVSLGFNSRWQRLGLGDSMV